MSKRASPKKTRKASQSSRTNLSLNKARRAVPWSIVASVAAITYVVVGFGMHAMIKQASLRTNESRARLEALRLENGQMEQSAAVTSRVSGLVSWTRDNGFVAPDESSMTQPKFNNNENQVKGIKRVARL